VMKKELLKEGMKCSVTRQINDVEGAMYKGDAVQVIEWTDVSKNGDDALIIFVVDDIGKHHTVGLKDIAPL